jgi:protein involved in polysaccharide export with SLBB domain
MTVSQALTSAGGLSNTAEASDVRLIRNKKGQMQVTPINMDEIKEGKTPDIIVEDQDVLVVGKNAIKSFFNTIKLGLFFPPFSVGVQ